MKAFVCLTDITGQPVAVSVNNITKMTVGAQINPGTVSSVIWFVDGTHVGIKLPLIDLLVVMNGT
jgi:hypothetical protein